MSAEPRVTIAFPTYRARAELLLPALDAARAQTFTDVELFVVDDGSEDDVVRAVEARGVRVYRNPTRLGLAGNWNRCVDLARGELLNVAHQDDHMHPAFVARAVDALDRAPRAGFVHTGWRAVDDRGAATGERWEHLADHTGDFARDGRDYFVRIVEGHTPVCCPTVVYRRAVFERAGRFDERFRFAADVDQFCRLLLVADVAYVHEVLLDYRRHPDSTSSATRQAQMYAELLLAKRRALEVARARGAFDAATLARLTDAVAREGCKKARKVVFDDPEAALAEVAHAVRLRPRARFSENAVVTTLRARYARLRAALGLAPATRSSRRARRE